MYVIGRRALWVVAPGFWVAAVAPAAMARPDPSDRYFVVLSDGFPASGSTVTATFTDENIRDGSVRLT